MQMSRRLEQYEVLRGLGAIKSAEVEPIRVRYYVEIPAEGKIKPGKGWVKFGDGWRGVIDRARLLKDDENATLVLEDGRELFVSLLGGDLFGERCTIKAQGLPKGAI